MPGSPSYDALKVKVLVVQSCLTFCDLMDYSLPGSSVHRILQARILEWVAISFSRPILRKSDILMEAALSWMEKEELDMQ